MVQARDLNRHFDIDFALAEYQNLLALGEGADVSSIVDLYKMGL
jgi:hypothetical protein